MDIKRNEDRENDFLNRVELDLTPMEERVIKGLILSYDSSEEPVVLDHITVKKGINTINERDKDKIYDEMAYRMKMLIENYEREKKEEDKRNKR